jgi:hypothetical protein
VLTAAVLSTVPAAAAAAESNACKVSLSASLNNTKSGDVKTEYLFGVAANSSEACADVSFTLTVTVQLPDGSMKSTPLNGEMRVRSQTRVEAVPFETDAKNTIKKYEVKMNSCQVCNAP